LQDLSRVRGFSRAVFRRPSGPHLAASQVENSRAMATHCHLEQRPTARLFHVIAVRSDGQYVKR
jgi:hypothetical protein